MDECIEFRSVVLRDRVQVGKDGTLNDTAETTEVEAIASTVNKAFEPRR